LARGGAAGGGGPVCLLPPATDLSAGDGSSRRRRPFPPATALDLAGTGSLFYFQFRDPIAILFCIQGGLCKKVEIVCNFEC
jgi:hypothetical protein